MQQGGVPLVGPRLQEGAPLHDKEAATARGGPPSGETLKRLRPGGDEAEGSKR